MYLLALYRASTSVTDGMFSRACFAGEVRLWMEGAAPPMLHNARAFCLYPLPRLAHLFGLGSGICCVLLPWLRC